MVVSITFNNYFCIFTNMICLIPVLLFYMDNNIYDGTYILCTGITSFLYHLNNNEPAVLDSKIVDTDMIFKIDTIYAETLIINVATYLLFYKNHNLRAAICSTILPFYLYLSNMDSSIIFIIRYSIIFIFGIIALIKYYVRFCIKKDISNKKFIMLNLGILLNGIQILAYEYLQNEYDYNFFHSLHHICGYLSVAIYFYGPITMNSNYKINKSKIRKLFNCKTSKVKDENQNNNLDDNCYPITISPSII